MVSTRVSTRARAHIATASGIAASDRHCCAIACSGFRTQLDVELLHSCAQTLLGEHDFEAFTLSDEPYKSYRRKILRSEWIVRPRLTEFWIEGESFTRRMVRSLVSYQLDVARGTRQSERFNELLEGAPREQGGATAAACGLYLAEVSFT